MDLTRPQRTAWKEFTSTKAYDDGIAYIKERMPRLSSATPPSADTIMFHAGKTEGYLLALDRLKLLAETPSNDQKSPDQPGLEAQ